MTDRNDMPRGLACLAVASVAGGPALARTNGPPKGRFQRFELPEIRTHYLRYVPRSYDHRTPAPELFFAHGAGARPEDYEEVLRGVSERFGMVLVIAKSPGASWDPRNAHRIVSRSTVQTEKACNIDPRKFFMAGHSAGANVAFALTYTVRNPVRGVLFVGAPRFPAAVQPGASKPPAVLYYGERDPFLARAGRANEQVLDRGGVKFVKMTRPDKDHRDCPSDAIVEAFDYLLNGKRPASASARAPTNETEPGGLRRLQSGVAFVPRRRAPGSPVLVVAEFPRRASRLVDMMKPALEEHGVIAVAPALALNGNQLNQAESMRKLDSVLSELRSGSGVRPGKLYGFAFSAAGRVGYQLVLGDPSRFAGLVIAASAPPTSELLRRSRRTRPPVLLVQGMADQVVRPRLAEDAEASLRKAGFRVTLHKIPGAGHMDVITKNASVFLKWVCGR